MNSRHIVRGTLLAFGLSSLQLSLAGPAAAFTEFVDPNPAFNNQFGAVVVPLSTGNVVITSPFDDAGGSQAGAVYLFNGATGALISTVRGSTADDQIGSDGVTALTNGNFVIRSRNWDNGAIVDAGAVTWGSGTTGVSGVISAANSLVGSTANDQIGSRPMRALTNGNYMTSSTNWDNGAFVNAGAATWGNGATGTFGAVSAANSLVGSKANDNVGSQTFALTNGNYLITSSNWDNGAVINAGAATWGNGATGTFGAVSAVNSLIGSTSNNNVGSAGAIALSNGHYVVLSSEWDNGAALDVGAATWCTGAAATSAFVTPGNSQIGSVSGDGEDLRGTALTNGNYVVRRPAWNNGAIVDAGAASWGNGATGTTGIVSAANSLVGSTTEDFVGQVGVTALTNGNYVVGSTAWDNGGTPDVGASTWGNGTTGISGAVSPANSLIGTSPFDQVGGNESAIALTNGNYLVSSGTWDNGPIQDVGSATWGNGTTGTTGVVSAANSLIGSTTLDNVGNLRPLALSNGNYVILSPDWDNGPIPEAGAVTWCSGTAATSAVVSPANSLIGGSAADGIGSTAIALTNGHYVVQSGFWDNGALENVGAVTWCKGTLTTSAVVSPANSLIGTTAFDAVGTLTALANGNYVVSSAQWSDPITNAFHSGAATWCEGTGATTGQITSGNSLLGVLELTGLRQAVDDPVNAHFIASFLDEDNGKVRVGPQAALIGVDGPRKLAGVRLLSPAPNPSSTGSRIAAVFPARDRISLVLVDVRGRTVRTLAKDQPVDAGEWSIRWDGRDQAGRNVPAGVYFVRLTTREAEVTGRLGIVR